MAMIMMPGRGSGPHTVRCDLSCSRPLPQRCSTRCFRQPMIVGGHASVPERYIERDPFYADESVGL